MEKEGVHALREDPTKFFVFANTDTNANDSDADNTDTDENHNNHSTTGIGKPIRLVNPVRDSSFIGFTGIPCPELIG